MADASSIRKASSLAPQAQRGSTFYKSAMRFVGNQAYINSGTQWVPVGNVVLSIPLDNTTPTTLPIFIADRPYNIISVRETHTATASGLLAQLLTTPATPVVTIVDPTGTGSGAIVEAVVTASTGAIASYTVVQGGATYGVGTYAVVTGPSTTQAVPGAVTLAGNAVSSIALGTAGVGYQPQTPAGAIAYVSVGGTQGGVYAGDGSVAITEPTNYGTAATLGAITAAGNHITAVALSTGGAGYLTAPAIVYTNGTNDTSGAATGAVVTATLTPQNV